MKKLEKALNSLYGRHEGIKAEHFFAPGRICLMGEHIDYNGGEAITVAISHGIHVVCRPTFNKILCLSSLQKEKELIVNLEEELTYDEYRAWGNYIVGMYQAFSKKGVKLKGAEILFDSTLPIASGLSSSAALLVLSAYVLNHFHATDLSKREIAYLSKHVENDFIGLQSGLIDPISIACGDENHALSFDCEEKELTKIPLSMNGYAFLVFDTGKKRKLSDTAYNRRTESCEKALSLINQKKEKEQKWKSTSEEDINLLEDKKLQKRAKHVVTEMKRVKTAKKMLENNDIPAFAKLMTASHESLKNDYEVSCNELDFFVDWANANKHCLGAKMTGAGFGGCAVAIINRSAAPELITEIEKEYFAATGLKGKAFLTEASDGVRKL